MPVTRLGLDGYGVRRAGSFAGRAPPVVVEVTQDGARWPIPRRKAKQERRRSREDIAREQKMVQEYLDELERRKAPPASEEPVSGRESQEAPTRSPEPAAPRLTEVMARAASAHQLQRIHEHEAAAAEDRARAEQERRRRQRAAAAAVLLMAH